MMNGKYLEQLKLQPFTYVTDHKSIHLTNNYSTCGNAVSLPTVFCQMSTVSLKVQNLQLGSVTSAPFWL